MRARQANLLLGEWDRFDDPEPVADPKKLGPEELFESQCRQFRLPTVERQVLFAKAAIGRLWRFDFAWRAYLLAVEIEGIVPRRIGKELVVGGRHGSVAGIIEDMEKYNAAIALGWSVLRFPQKYVKPERAIETTMRVLAARGWEPPHA